MSYRQQTAREFANKAKELGFTVYLAKSETYGLITDKNKDRVLSFQSDFGLVKVSGNYQPQGGIGTGWEIAKDLDSNDLNQRQLDLFLNAIAPNWAVGNAIYPVKYSTLENHLEAYQKSSKYKQVFKPLVVTP